MFKYLKINSCSSLIKILVCFIFKKMPVISLKIMEYKEPSCFSCESGFTTKKIFQIEKNINQKYYIKSLFDEVYLEFRKIHNKAKLIAIIYEANGASICSVGMENYIETDGTSVVGYKTRSTSSGLYYISHVREVPHWIDSILFYCEL